MRFSIVTPVFNPPTALFDACAASVLGQRFDDWEWILVDDASSEPQVATMLDRFNGDARVLVVRRQVNAGIVAASNDALAAATGEFIVLLDHDDQLTSDALSTIDAALLVRPDTDYLYSDEDKLDPDGRAFELFLKPDWSPQRLRSQNYCCHVSVARRSVVAVVGGFHEGFDGSQDHDLILRVTERARHVEHVPRVLYRWCVSASSTAGDIAAKPYATEAGRRAVQAHCDRIGMPATVEHDTVPGTYRVRRTLPSGITASIVIPTRGTSGRVWGVERVFVEEAVRSIVERTTGIDFEIIVVVDDSTPPAVLARLAVHDAVRLVRWEHPFNFSGKVNLGAAAATGNVIALVNDDTEVIDAEWLHTMAAIALETDVGAVGAKLLYSDGRLQHAGHLLNYNPLHVFHGADGEWPGPSNLLAVEREVSSVTAAVMVVRRDIWHQYNGFDPAFAVNFNDLDFCLRLRADGRRVIVTPHARLFHFESITRETGASDAEVALLRQRWQHELEHDPYGNPNLAVARSDWVPAAALSALALPRSVAQELRAFVKRRRQART